MCVYIYIKYPNLILKHITISQQLSIFYVDGNDRNATETKIMCENSKQVWPELKHNVDYDT